MPILLELGARAARGDFRARSLLLVSRTLAEAAGRPLSDNPVPAGLQVIQTAFATVLQWAVAPDWDLRESQPEPARRVAKLAYGRSWRQVPR